MTLEDPASLEGIGPKQLLGVASVCHGWHLQTSSSSLPQPTAAATGKQHSMGFQGPRPPLALAQLAMFSSLQVPLAQLPQAQCQRPIHLPIKTNPKAYCTYSLFARHVTSLFKWADYFLEDDHLLVLRGTQHCLNHLPQTVCFHRPCYRVVPDFAEQVVVFQNVHTAL